MSDVDSPTCTTRQPQATNTIDLDRPGFVRIETVLTIYPVSRAAWYQGIKDGKYPKAVQLSRRSVGWPTSAIKALIENPPFSKVR